MKGGDANAPPPFLRSNGTEPFTHAAYLVAEAVFVDVWLKLTVTSLEETVPLGFTATSTYLPALAAVVLLIVKLGVALHLPATPSFFH